MYNSSFIISIIKDMTTSNVSIEDINDLYEEIKPLNFGRRILFQRYCSLLVREKRIKESDVEEFLTAEFLFEDNEEKVSKLRKIITLIVNVGTVYVAYKLIRGLI